MPDSYVQPPLPMAIRPLANEESGRLRMKYPDLPTSPTKCLTCRGKKAYRWYAPGSRQEVVEYDCDCVDQWVLSRYLLSSNISLLFQRLGWADLTTVDDDTLALVQEYLERDEDYVPNGIGMILHGPPGTGKTSLAALILKDLLARGHDGYFTTFSEMIDTYTGGWTDSDERKWFHRRIKNAKVLVIDDIGREYQGRKASGLPEATFEEVIRHRVASLAPTILTTNLSLQRLQEGYGGNVMSLLRERATTREVTGADFRDTQRNRTLDEIDAGLTRPVVLG